MESNYSARKSIEKDCKRARNDARLLLGLENEILKREREGKKKFQNCCFKTPASI